MLLYLWLAKDDEKKNDPEAANALKDLIAPGTGYPTAMLCDADRQPYASAAGYRTGSGIDGWMRRIYELYVEGRASRLLRSQGMEAPPEAVLLGAQQLHGQELLFGLPAYDELLDDLRASDDPALQAWLAPIQAAADEVAELKSILPQQRGEEPDWDKIHKFFKRAKYILEERDAMNVLYGLAMWLVEQDRGKEALPLTAIMKKHPSLSENEAALEAIEALERKARGEDEDG